MIVQAKELTTNFVFIHTKNNKTDTL